MDATGTTERRAQEIRQLCAASLRALGADPRLELLGSRPYRGTTVLPFNAPHLYPPSPGAAFESFRGASDGIALRTLHSDTAAHLALLPENPSARLVFEVLEQFRCESLAALPGVVSNLRARHEAWSKEYLASGLTETSLGMLLYTILQVTRSRITGEPVVSESEDMIEATRANLSSTLGPLLPALRRNTHSQSGFAPPALQIARLVADAVEDLESRAPARKASKAKASKAAEFSLLVDVEQEAALIGRAGTGTSTLAAAAGGYTVFTRAYDKESAARDLVREDLLHGYRERIASRVHTEAVNTALLAKRLQGLLCVPERSGHDSGAEEGLLDVSRLGQLIASPTESRLFKTERFEPAAAAAVTFLVDCSGSMKQHAEGLAAFLDVLVRALERIDVPCEVLGYTTGAWNGGRALKHWRRAGAPPNPGRLNELCHLVFKDAATSWRSGRPGLAAMLKSTLYREGVDGEAVRWALSRLGARSEDRRILVVVTDGSPADGATANANDENYLQHDLAAVLRGAETAGSTTILGLGLGLDMSPYFRRSTILDAERLGGSESVRDLLGLLQRSLRPGH
ncbi:cobalt chelatase [Arthrobacter sp. AQ5-05]|uniref:cobaltochelatase CobT-related protein n=1 Tax=Arthrobacter sp. AQ5-05 TaxID=2184581 RepID=UPI000DCBB9C1|nr:cobalt chelatase [Arthrobacter sp. AQ5-05]RAX48919.1 cobalt chelatase [Arthrobacter sp. AQ5-05]